eukprot:4430756-Prymnesium_polylepis.2
MCVCRGRALVAAPARSLRPFEVVMSSAIPPFARRVDCEFGDCFGVRVASPCVRARVRTRPCAAVRGRSPLGGGTCSVRPFTKGLFALRASSNVLSVVLINVHL